MYIRDYEDEIRKFECVSHDEFIDLLIEWDFDFNYSFDRDEIYMWCDDKYYKLEYKEDINDVTSEAFCEYKRRLDLKGYKLK